MKLRSFITAALTTSVLILAWVPPAEAQDVKERTIRWGHLVQPGNPNSLGVQKFAEVLLKKSGGKMKVQEFPNSELGSELQQQSAMRGGTQEMFVSAPTSLVGMVPEFGLFDLPFSFASLDEVHAIVDGPLGQLLIGKLAEKGIIGLAYWDLGFRNPTNSKRPITRMEDFAGLKIRTMPNPVYLETFRLLGANPVPMNFGEVYMALESKTIDAQENPLSVIYSNRLYEVQKYLSVDNHTATENLVQVGKKFWDSLSPAEQRIMRETAAETLAYQRGVSLQQSQDLLSELKKKGVIVNEVAPAELARMRQATKPVADKFFAQYDPEIVKLYHAEMAKLRSK